MHHSKAIQWLCRSSALQRAALSIQATAAWLAEHKFLSREEMQQYKNLVSSRDKVCQKASLNCMFRCLWCCCCSKGQLYNMAALLPTMQPLLAKSPLTNMQVWWEDLDSQNRPILMVRLGQALNECKSRAEADRVAECIVGQVS